MAAYYFATVATDGSITAPATDDTLPAYATALTKEQYDTILAVLAAGGRCKLLNGVVLPTLALLPATPPLDFIKTAVSIKVDEAAERARLLFLTPGSGQALEYEATRLEAVAVIAMTATPAAAIDPADYPWLKAELDALASVGQTVTIVQVAGAVMQQAAAWVTVGAAIKQIRRAAKLEIEAATTVDQVNQILAAIVWPALAA